MPGSTTNIQPIGDKTNSLTRNSVSGDGNRTRPAQSLTRTDTTPTSSATSIPGFVTSSTDHIPPHTDTASDGSSHTSTTSNTHQSSQTGPPVQTHSNVDPGGLSTNRSVPAPDKTGLTSTVSSTLPTASSNTGSTSQKSLLQSTQTASRSKQGGQVVIVGDKTATLPAVTMPTQIATLDQTFSVHPLPSESLGINQPTLAIIGSQTVTLPLVQTASVLTTLGTSFTLEPPLETTPATTQSRPNNPSSVVVIDGQTSFNIPPLFQKTTLTTGGRTITVSPEGPPTITIENPPNSAASSSSQGPKVIIIGGSSITLPSVLSETIITTNGQVLTLSPPVPPTATVDQPPNPTSMATTTTDKVIGPLPEYTTWPPGAFITPIATKVDKPKKSDDDEKSSVIPCKLWFFSVSHLFQYFRERDSNMAQQICIEFGAVNILGWKLSLPPGIYPPGPPPIPNIKFPPPIAIKGSLPPWPKFT